MVREKRERLENERLLKKQKRESKESVNSGGIVNYSRRAMNTSINQKMVQQDSSSTIHLYNHMMNQKHHHQKQRSVYSDSSTQH